jgi:hypothetical protein
LRLLACGVAVIAMCAAGAVARATAQQSAAQLRSTALADADERGSVREVESERTRSLVATFTEDLATHDGRQNITRSGGEQAHVLIVGDTAYVAGNRAALIHYFGFPAAVASKIGARWVSIPSSSSAYSTVAGDATLPSAMTALAIAGKLTETAPTTINGQAVIGVRTKASIPGTSPATLAATLYISRASEPLPVRASYTSSKGGSATITLSNWGEKIAFTAPTNAIPLSQLEK